MPGMNDIIRKLIKNAYSKARTQVARHWYDMAMQAYRSNHMGMAHSYALLSLSAK